MVDKFKQNDCVYNLNTSDVKKVFISLGETFVATDGSVNVVDEFRLCKDKAEGDSDESIG